MTGTAAALPAGATPAPGSTSGTPAPNAPAAPAVAAVPGTPAVEPAAAPAPLASTSTNAQSAASDAAQLAATQAAEATPATLTPETPASLPEFRTGNKAFDQAAELMQAKGVEGYDAILASAAEGIVSLTQKAQLVEKLGPEVANMVISQIETELTSLREAGTVEGTRLKEYAAQRFGYDADKAGETWDALVNFARSEASGITEADLAELSSLLDAGGIKGQMAIDHVAALYEKSQGFSKAPNLMTGDGGVQTGFKPLSKVEYQTQMREAQLKFGEGSNEVNALRQQRTVSLQRGY